MSSKPLLQNKDNPGSPRQNAAAETKAPKILNHKPLLKA